jgi:hypothetical protein
MAMMLRSAEASNRKIDTNDLMRFTDVENELHSAVRRRFNAIRVDRKLGGKE